MTLVSGILAGVAGSRLITYEPFLRRWVMRCFNDVDEFSL